MAAGMTEKLCCCGGTSAGGGGSGSDATWEPVKGVLTSEGWAVTEGIGGGDGGKDASPTTTEELV